MLTHEKVWRAIDLVAQQQGITPSRLAQKAGLDATTFNKAKRFNRDGRERWPSTETLARVLEIAQLDLVAFGELVNALPDVPNHTTNPEGLEQAHTDVQLKFLGI